MPRPRQLPAQSETANSSGGLAVLGCLIEHDGTNNRFHSANKSPLGLPHEGRAIELASSARLLHLMREDDTNIMQNVKADEASSGVEDYF